MLKLISTDRSLVLSTVVMLLMAVYLLGFQNCSQPVFEVPKDPPKSVSVKVLDYCPSSSTSFKEVFATNHSSVLEEGNFVSDFDRDGLSDSYELDENTKAKYGIHVGTQDTNADFYSDLINIRMGFDVDNQFRLSTCVTSFNDYDLDGLTDCEEAALTSDPLDPDSDDDGIPDGVELRATLNPIDPADASLDADQDGMSNLEEVKLNSPLKQTNSAYAKDIFYGYELEEYTKSGNQTCYNVTVDNIPIMEVTNGNYIRIYLFEVELQSGGSQTNEVQKIQQVNLVIDRNVVPESLIEIYKDNSSRSQLEIVNIEDLE